MGVGGRLVTLLRWPSTADIQDVSTDLLHPGLSTELTLRMKHLLVSPVKLRRFCESHKELQDINIKE